MAGITEEAKVITDGQRCIVAIKTAMNTLDKWGATPEQQQQILQVSKAAYYKYRSGTAASLSHDQMTRISYLLNIHAALRTVFENPDNVYGFMKMENHNPYFNGQTPLALISSGDFGALYEVARRIDALRDGLI